MCFEPWCNLCRTHLLASSNMVSVAMQESSSAPNATLAWGTAGFSSDVCFVSDVIRLSNTCTTVSNSGSDFAIQHTTLLAKWCMPYSGSPSQQSGIYIGVHNLRLVK